MNNSIDNVAHRDTNPPYTVEEPLKDQGKYQLNNIGLKELSIHNTQGSLLPNEINALIWPNLINSVNVQPSMALE